MTEVLGKVQDTEPSEQNFEGEPSLEAQKGFFRQALGEGVEMGDRPRLLKGSYYADFESIIRLSDEAIKAVDPQLTPEYSMPTSYMPVDVMMKYNALPNSVRARLERIRTGRVATLREFAQDRTINDLASQGISDGVLSIPPFCSQDEDWRDSERFKGCMNACFRMVFGAATGWRPSQAALSEELVRQHRTSIVEDVVYGNLFQTEAFREICDKEVMTLEIIGADLTIIEKLASKIKAKNSDAQVYCVASISSASAPPNSGIWHSCIILGADGEKVTWHDPGSAEGAFKEVPIADFGRRWAVAYNRVQLFIVA